MNFRVHDDSVYTNTLKHIFRILKQPYSDSTSAVIFANKVQVFKCGLTSAVVQVRLHYKNSVPNQLPVSPNSNAPQHATIA